MDKEELKKLAADPRFISGIYNYCDRWCERCTFTSRCLSFAMDEDRLEDRDSLDMNNERFWGKLSESLRLTFEMLEEMAEREGIDLNDIPEDDTYIEEHNRNREIAKEHKCSISAKAYIDMVEKWFKASEDLFSKKAQELGMKAKLELPDTDPMKEALGLKDTVDVIRHYQYFLYPKIMRALEGKLEGTPDILKEFPKDSDGSAKIALIAMDRSISAWSEMLKQFPEREEQILNILVHLERLRRKTEEAFPDARAFVRPGFDIVQ